MKKNRTLFVIILSLSLLTSCSDRKTENNKTSQQETPKALQDEKLEIKSYSRSSSGDLLEELYQELVDKTPELKKLEEDIDAFSLKPNTLKNKFLQYDSKSNNYYSSANNKASAITDSLLKMKINTFITTSSKQYTAKTAELNSFLNQISNNVTTLNDKHNVLKIVLTLPLIEKYQSDNKPDKKEFLNLIKEQENLVKNSENLTPKY